ncbi:RHS repeat-associated core domain-containing protein [Pseudomonas monteilii]|uniref:RHS repeat-associated core domain-containing protein n=1 Tax=Pseudomonas TaxID=286 RepID=UPI0015A57C30|nr:MULTISPECIES: RHS repeat-associated core domain-containing protein [Pseudomonas]MBH3455947.1 RHS repeat-associated core domain-containing protein [Pseudomonas monteilii]
MNATPIFRLYFYQNKSLISIKEHARTHSAFRNGEQPLALMDSSKTGDSCLIAINASHSVLNYQNTNQKKTNVYSPYGYDPAENSILELISFTGQALDSMTNCYALGAGHRNYSPILMRFLSPDSLSPFRDGGINTYAYCSSDPINYSDPSAQTRRVVSNIGVPRGGVKAQVIKRQAQASKDLSKRPPLQRDSVTHPIKGEKLISGDKRSVHFNKHLMPSNISHGVNDEPKSILKNKRTYSQNDIDIGSFNIFDQASRQNYANEHNIMILNTLPQGHPLQTAIQSEINLGNGSNSLATDNAAVRGEIPPLPPRLNPTT